jgi:hypothetical protein
LFRYEYGVSVFIYQVKQQRPMDNYIEISERLDALDNLIERQEKRLSRWNREVDEAENMLLPMDERPDRALWSGEALKGTPDEGLVVKRDQVRQKLRALRAERERLLEGREEAGNSDVPGTEHDHAFAIGTALLREFSSVEDALAHFHGSKGPFKEWAGEQIGRSPSTAYEALNKAGLWANTRQGTSDGLRPTLKRTVNYADRGEDLRIR